jgi:hypothetical protein
MSNTAFILLFLIGLCCVIKCTGLSEAGVSERRGCYRWAPAFICDGRRPNMIDYESEP